MRIGNGDRGGRGLRHAPVRRLRAREALRPGDAEPPITLPATRTRIPCPPRLHRQPAGVRCRAPGCAIVKLKRSGRTIRKESAPTSTGAGGLSMSVPKPVPSLAAEALEPDMMRRLERLGLSGHAD